MKTRMTILGVMGFIAFLAICMGGLRSNDERLAAVVFAMTVLALLTATLVAIDRRGMSGWAGFAVFGWAQFLICQPHSAPPVGPSSLMLGLACRLVPYSRLSYQPYEHQESPDLMHRLWGPGYAATLWEFDRYPMFYSLTRYDLKNPSNSWSVPVPIHTLRSALCLSIIIVGFVGTGIGGLLARRSAARRVEQEAEAP